MQDSSFLMQDSSFGDAQFLIFGTQSSFWIPNSSFLLTRAADSCSHPAGSVHRCRWKWSKGYLSTGSSLCMHRRPDQYLELQSNRPFFNRKSSFFRGNSRSFCIFDRKNRNNSVFPSTFVQGGHHTCIFLADTRRDGAVLCLIFRRWLRRCVARIKSVVLIGKISRFSRKSQSF